MYSLCFMISLRSILLTFGLLFIGYDKAMSVCKGTKLKGKSCKFPFEYEGVRQNSCIILDKSQPTRFWCSVSNFPNGTVRAWDTCDQQCPINKGKKSSLET